MKAENPRKAHKDWLQAGPSGSLHLFANARPQGYGEEPSSVITEGGKQAGCEGNN